MTEEKHFSSGYYFGLFRQIALCLIAMCCSAYAIYGHSSSYVHIDQQSHGLGAYDGGYDGHDAHLDYHVRFGFSPFNWFWFIRRYNISYFHLNRHRQIINLDMP